MKRFPLFLIAAFCFGGLPTDRVQADPPSTANELIISYETPTMKIIVRNRSITKTIQKQEFDNPVSAIPSRTTSESKTGEITLEELQSLKTAIRKSGFMKLDDFYGAPAKERYYPYTISVTMHGKTKQVVHRSNPGYNVQLPSAFSDIAAQLTKLAERL